MSIIMAATLHDSCRALCHNMHVALLRDAQAFFVRNDISAIIRARPANLWSKNKRTIRGLLYENRYSGKTDSLLANRICRRPIR